MYKIKKGTIGGFIAKIYFFQATVRVVLQGGSPHRNLACHC